MSARELDSCAGELEELAGLLGTRLAQWDYRAESADGAACIRAGHGAVETIDDMLAKLHRVREALIGELRADADERDRRVDAMLAERRGSAT